MRGGTETVPFGRTVPVGGVRNGFHQAGRGAGVGQGVEVDVVVVLVRVCVRQREEAVHQRERVEVGGEIGIRVVLIRDICGVVWRRLRGAVRRDAARDLQAGESREDA